jgi:tRNA U54 and U55 pseudouridine synthase Pus10
MIGFLGLVFLFVVASQATAQIVQSTTAAAPDDQTAVAADTQVPDINETVDVADLIRKIRKKPAETEFDHRKPMRAIARSSAPSRPAVSSSAWPGTSASFEATRQRRASPRVSRA